MLLLFSLAIMVADRSSHILAQEDVKDADADDPLVKQVEAASARFELRGTGDGKPMTAVTVMRWRNDIRRQEGIALMRLWTRDGRPVAQASIYPWNGTIIHEFDSLAEGGVFSAFDGETSTWSPEAAGVEFREVPDAPAPADSPVARLRQMKSIAESFQAVMTGWKADKSDREVLRVLPRELYRFDAKALKAADSPIRDGGVFAYVQGTDPEIILLLQANETDGGSRWEYAFARATSGGLEVKLQEEIVWSAPQNYASHDPSAVHFSINEPLN
jgi:hypothetical protein